MTKLILNPGDLSSIFPDISISNPQRIRILCQVIKYIPNESCLIIDKIPTVAESSTNKESLVKIDIFDILEDILSIEIINKGTIINIDGYYDGEKIQPIDIYEINGINFTIENIEILNQLNQMKSLT
ncbi:Protein involved in telomere maintenance [Candida albicans P75010]|nr:Protein involved in telomere maintenance [Candida albicans P75010]